MVITKLIGGLGNQMFQYAVGRALSLVRQVPLKQDVSAFRNYTLHQRVDLKQIFNCGGDLATESDVREVLKWQHTPHFRQFFSRPGMVYFRRRELVVEPYFHYWDGIKNVPDNSYLAGYWQSEKYFSDFTAEIRGDFTFNVPLFGENAKFAQLIKSHNSVSLHVRRGDYVSNPRATAVHGLCSLEYYYSTIRYVAERVAEPHFFVFSDDIAWVKDNLHLDFPRHYVEHNCAAEGYNDMRLMSLCRHHIIANSSFSWWGAWLNPDPHKIVVAPQRWFANQNDTKDLLPPSWVQL